MQAWSKCFVSCNLARRFIYKVMIVGKLHDHDLFVTLLQLFAEKVWSRLYFIVVCNIVYDVCTDEP